MSLADTITLAHMPLNPDPDPERTNPTKPPGGPQPTARALTISTTEGIHTTGRLPSGVRDDPSRSGISLDSLLYHLHNMHHILYFHTPPFVPTPNGETTPDNPYGLTFEDEALLFTIESHPYDEDPICHAATGSFYVAGDCRFDGLSQQDLARFATQLRAQADRLDREVRPALITARIDRTTHHTPKPHGPCERTSSHTDLTARGIT